MSDKNFPEVINEIHLKDNRYGKGAYYFIREALDHTLKSADKKKKKKRRTKAMYQVLSYSKELKIMHLIVLVQ